MRPNNFALLKQLWCKILAQSHQQKKRNFFKIIDKTETKQPIVYPNQYPSYPLNDSSPIISRERPLRHITPKYQLPDQNIMEPQDILFTKNGKQWKSPDNAFTLNVGLIGPVNAGKSQLFGALAHHISAISPKASTTSQIIMGVKSFERDSQQGIKNVQIKYYDTPGLMYKKQGFISRGWEVLSQIDFSLLVVDSAKRFDDMVKESIKRLEKHRDYPNFMKALVLNKIDLVDNRRKFDQLIREVEKYGKFDKIFYVSSKTKYGIPQLQQYLIKMSKPGDWQHPAEVKTDRTATQIHEQMLREAIYNRSYKQVPHQVDVQCVSFSPLTNNKDQIIFNLFVETENQQRMMTGTKGRNIIQMINRFKVQYAKMYEREVQPIVSVKIRNKFRSKNRVRELYIYKNSEEQDKNKLRILEQQLAFKRLKGSSRDLPAEDQSQKQ